MANRSGSLVWLLSVMMGLLAVPVSQGQTTSITSSGLNTKVTLGSVDPAGRQNYDITGGTRPGNGGNLFHSFGDFSVGTNNVARFGNDSGLATTNILSRVTGGNPSNIFGEINTANFPGANLYLINPAGVVFGSTATLNVGGSVKISTADYLRLADGLRFNAIPGPQDALLSSSPVVAFGFLNPHPRPISVQGATLEVQQHTPDEPARSLTLVGGDINLSSGTLKAEAGINLVSVASRGEVRTDTGPNGINQPTLGTIRMTDALLDTAASENPIRASGDIVIRAGQLVMDRSTISASTNQLSLAPQLTGQVTLQVTDTIRANESHIVSNGSGLRNGQEGVFLEAGHAIRLTRSTVEADNGPGDLGRAGGVALSASIISLDGSHVSAAGFTTQGSGGADGGSIAIEASQLQLKNGSELVAIGSSRGGSVVINAGETVRIDEGSINVSTLNLGPLNAGNISITAGEAVRLNHAELFAGSPGTFSGSAGNIVIDAGKNVVSQGHSSISADGGNTGGNIILQAPERIQLDGDLVTARAGGNGAAGSITLSSDVVRLRDHTVVQSTAVNGPGGTIAINANDFRNLNSRVNVKSQFGPNGTVSIQPLP